MPSQTLPLGFSFGNLQANKEPSIHLAMPTAMNETGIELTMASSSTLHHQPNLLLSKSFVDGLPGPDSYQSREYEAVFKELQSKNDPEQME